MIDAYQQNTIRDIHFADGSNSTYDQIDHDGFIDLSLEILIFTTGEKTITTFQKVRIPLSEDQNMVTTEFNSAWSFNDKPNEIGSSPLNYTQSFEEKNWTINDMASIGGSYLDPSSGGAIYNAFNSLFLKYHWRSNKRFEY